MNEAELREELAPRIAAKLLARAGNLNLADAEVLAHEIIATVQAAQLAGGLWKTPGTNPANAGENDG